MSAYVIPDILVANYRQYLRKLNIEICFLIDTFVPTNLYQKVNFGINTMTVKLNFFVFSFPTRKNMLGVIKVFGSSVPFVPLVLLSETLSYLFRPIQSISIFDHTFVTSRNVS